MTTAAGHGQPVALVTGANTGIGLATARALAARGYHVVLTGRTLTRIEPVAERVRVDIGTPLVEAVALDLGDFSSIDACASEVLRRCSHLDLLVNNAGLAPRRGQITPSGFEQAFGVNHVGHFLLTTRLLDRLRASAPARVVTLASHAHYASRGFDWHALRAPTRTWLGYSEYATSKLANVLFTRELARRLRGSGVTTYAVHPGVVASDIWRHVIRPLRALLTLPMLTTTEGAACTLHCGTSASAGEETGLYYDRSQPRAPSALALDDALAQELWARTERWIAAM